MSTDEKLKTIMALLLRHELHNNDQVNETGLNHARRTGLRFRERYGSFEPRLVVCSPKNRAIQTVQAFSEGLFGFEATFIIDEGIGDVSTGQYPLTTEEKALFMGVANERQISPEKALLSTPALAEKMQNRGEEAAKVCREYVLDAAKEGIDMILFSGHGGRWEPMISRLQGKTEVNEPDFLMETGTLALLTFQVDGAGVRLVEAKYLGDLS